MVHDPEFSSGRPSKSNRRRFPPSMRELVYAHLGAAILTALPTLLRQAGYFNEANSISGMSLLAFFTFLVFPPLIIARAVIDRAPEEKWAPAALATVALSILQLIAVFPAIQ